jgi:hypothetical protein
VKSLAGLLAFLMSIAIHNAEANTVVVFGNGIWTQKTSAQDSLDVLEEKLQSRLTSDQFQSLSFELAYNKTGIPEGDILRGSLRDLFESFIQLSEESSSQFWRMLADIDPIPDSLQQAFQDSAASVDKLALVTVADIQKHISRYKVIIADQQKVVVIAHSQGNFFANQSYGNLTPEEQNRFSIISVATPDGFVAGQDPPIYTTLCEDFIWKIPGALVYNVRNNSALCHPFPTLYYRGHFFVESYLASGSNSESKIINDVISHLDFTVGCDPLVSNCAPSILNPVAMGRYITGTHCSPPGGCAYGNEGITYVGQGQAAWVSFDISSLTRAQIGGTVFRFTQLDTTNTIFFPLTINIYDVSTSFDRLIIPRNPLGQEGEQILMDLSTGAVYASFEVTADGEGKSYDVPLNDVAIRDLRNAVDNGGHFFGIGLANVILDVSGYIRLGNPELRISTP